MGWKRLTAQSLLVRAAAGTVVSHEIIAMVSSGPIRRVQLLTLTGQCDSGHMSARDISTTTSLNWMRPSLRICMLSKLLL